MEYRISHREQEVLRLIAYENTNDETAATLHQQSNHQNAPEKFTGKTFRKKYRRLGTEEL